MVKSSNCPNCHSMEHELEKKQDRITDLTQTVSELKANVRNSPDAPGHKSFTELLDCPGCGPAALSEFEAAGGAVLRPGEVKPTLARIVKEVFPVFSDGIEVERR